MLEKENLKGMGAGPPYVLKDETGEKMSSLPEQRALAEAWERT